MEEARQHRDIRLCPENYLGCRWYFVTLCAHDRVKYFRKKTFCDWVLRVLREESTRNWFLVKAYCLMPDHLHLLLQGSSLNADLLKFINRFKQRTSYGFWALEKKTLWQVSFYDHILRDEDGPADVAWYIWLNPVRGGLVKKVEEYPYSGPFVRDWDAGEARGKAWVPPRVGK
jgi:putative transposase